MKARHLIGGTAVALLTLACQDSPTSPLTEGPVPINIGDLVYRAGAAGDCKGSS